jgi:hypothetical protein
LKAKRLDLGMRNETIFGNKKKTKNKNIFLESRIPSTAVVVSLVLVDMFWLFSKKSFSLKKMFVVDTSLLWFS